MLKFVKVDLNLFPVYDILTEETEKDIGYIELEIQSESVYVADIEIYDKREGNGRLAITQLLEKHKKNYRIFSVFSYRFLEEDGCYIFKGTGSR